MSFHDLLPSLIEIITTNLNLDDFSNFLIFCEQSQISTLRNNSFKFSKLFLCKQISQGIECIDLISSKHFDYDFDYIHCQQKFIKLSKLIAHVVESSTLRLTQYTDGDFSIEYKGLNEEDFVPVAFVPTDTSFKKLFKKLCSQKLLHFIPLFDDAILMLFKNGEIHLENGKIEFICSDNLINFVSSDKTYLVRYFKLEDTFLVYYISNVHAPELFYFNGAAFWGKILMNRNQNLDLKFFIQNGIECSSTSTYVKTIYKTSIHVPIRLKCI